MEAYRWLHAYRDRVGSDLSHAWEDITAEDPSGYRDVGGHESWSRKFDDNSHAEVLEGPDGFPIIRVVGPTAQGGYDWTVDAGTGMAASPHADPVAFGAGRDLPAPDPGAPGAQASVGHNLETDPRAQVVSPIEMPETPDPSRVPVTWRPSEAGADLDPYGVNRSDVTWDPKAPRLPKLDEAGQAASLKGSAAWRKTMDVDGASRNTYLPADEGIQRLSRTESLLILEDGSSVHYHHEPITQLVTQPKITKFTVSVPHLAVRPGTVTKGETKTENNVEPHTFERVHHFSGEGSGAVLIGFKNSLSANDPSGKTHTETGYHAIGTQGDIQETTEKDLKRRANREVDKTYRRGYDEADAAVNARRRGAQREDATALIAERGSPLMMSAQVARFGEDTLAGAREHGAAQGPVQSKMEQMAGWVQRYAALHPGVNGEQFAPQSHEMEDPRFVEEAWNSIRGVMYNSWQNRQRGKVLSGRDLEQAEAWDQILNAPADAPLNAATAKTTLPRAAWSASLMNGLTSRVRGIKEKPVTAPSEVRGHRQALATNTEGPFEVLEAHATAQHAKPAGPGIPREKFDHTEQTTHFHGATTVEELEARMSSAQQGNPENPGRTTAPRRAVVKIREGGKEKYVTLNARAGKTMVSDQPPTKAKHHGGQKLRFVAYNPAGDEWKSSEGTPAWSTDLVMSMQERADREGRAPTIEDLSPSHPARDPKMSFKTGIVSENNVPKMFTSISAATAHLKSHFPGQDHVLIPVHGEQSDLADRGDPIEKEDPVVSTRARITVARGDGSESQVGWYGSAHKAAVQSLERHAAAKDIHDLVHSGAALGPQLRSWVTLNNDGASPEGMRSAVPARPNVEVKNSKAKTFTRMAPS